MIDRPMHQSVSLSECSWAGYAGQLMCHITAYAYAWTWRLPIFTPMYSINRCIIARFVCVCVFFIMVSTHHYYTQYA